MVPCAIYDCRAVCMIERSAEKAKTTKSTATIADKLPISNYTFFAIAANPSAHAINSLTA